MIGDYMNKIRIRRLKIISILLLFVLIVEVCYIGFHVLFQEKKSIYFEGINAIIGTRSSYITVGSNNDNDLHYEKGKISFYDLKKQKTFEKLYNVGFNSAFFGVAVDDNDDIIAVGSYEKTEDDHVNLVRRALMVKYDKKGNLIFEKDYSLLDNSKYTSILCVEDGYLVVGQSIYQNTKLGSKSGGAILVKYDKEGHLLWNKNYGSSKSALFQDLIVINQFIYVVGVDERNIGVIAQYDLDGNFIKDYRYLYTDSLGFSGITVFNNSIYVSGSHQIDSHHTDAFIAQYDLDCELVNTITYPDQGMSRFNKIIIDDQEQLIAIGNTAITTKTDTVQQYNHNGIIAKYDSQLKLVDSVSYGDERDDYFTDVLFDKDCYLVVGYSSYEDGSYMSKFIRYSRALKVLGVE